LDTGQDYRKVPQPPTRGGSWKGTGRRMIGQKKIKNKKNNNNNTMDYYDFKIELLEMKNNDFDFIF